MNISITNTVLTIFAKTLKTLAFIACALPIVCAEAQNVIPLTSKQGLRNSQVRDIYQDSRNNVWIGTQDGLYRYDGAKLRGYYHDKHDDKSLGFNYVVCLMEYDHDRVLVGTKRGLYEYDYRTDSFRFLPFLSENKDTLHLHVFSLCKMKEKEVAASVGIFGGYSIVEENGRLCCKQSTEYITSNVSCTQLLSNSKGDLFAVNDMHELLVRKNGAKSYTRVSRTYDIVAMCLGDDDNVYVGTLHNGLLRCDLQNMQLVKVSPENENFVTSSVVNVENGLIGVCTDGQGLKLYNVHTGRFTQSNVRTPAFDFTQSNVKDVLFDNKSNLWIGIFWKGVFVMPFSRTPFSYVGRNSSSTNVIGTNCVTAVADKGHEGLWVATDNCGLYQISMDGSTGSHVEGLPTTISAICQDNDGNMYIGSAIGDCMQFNTRTGKVVNLSKTLKNADNLSNSYAVDIDFNGNIWFGNMGNGVSVYNPRLNHVETFTATANTGVPKKSRVFVNAYVKSLKVNGTTLCVGTADGLEIFSIGKGYNLKAVARCGVGLQINAIRVDASGVVWAATTEGLLKWKPGDNDKCKIYTMDDGLPSDFVASLEIPESGHTIWLSTHHGICCFDPVKGRAIHNYFEVDGLQDEEFADNASMLKDGVIYFGGINGLTYFRPDEVVSSTGTSANAGDIDIQIVDFYVFGKSISGGQKSGSYTAYEGYIADASRVDLCHTDNTFSIDLAVMNISGHGIRYEYSIDGGDWVSLGVDQHTVSFINMAPGTYVVKVRALHSDVALSEKELTICVHPAWYATDTAKIIYCLLFMVIAYLISLQVKERLRARKVLEHHRQKEQLNEARIQFFMNISHEIRTPMTLILSPLEKLMNIDKDEVHQRNYKLMFQNAQRILRLINQLMDVRKIEKGEFTIEYTKVEAVSFLQGLFEVFEISARSRNITYEFRHDMEKLDVYVDAQSLDKIVMNLLSNAFKFTADGGKISLVLSSPDAQSFTVEVIDDGVGIPDEEKTKVFRRFYSSHHQNGYIGTGIGLNLTYLLVGLHNGTIEVRDNPAGHGTDMYVQLPVGEEQKMTAATDSLATVVDVEQEPTVKPGEPEIAPTIVQPTATKRSGKKYNVVVVDDEIEIRQYIRTEFEAEYNITECGNGKEAWDYVLKNPESVDLVISDISMPMMDGDELCKRVKANYNTCQIPVVLLTAKATDADRIAGAVSGADAYVTKPFNLELLRATVSNLLMSRVALKGRYGSDMVKENTIEKIEVVSPDQQFLEKVNKLISKHIDDPDMSVESIADTIGFSRVHFYRKIKELTGQTPLNYVKTIRLQQAARLLVENKMDVTGVSVATGFRTLSTFSTSFKELYGMTPSEYVKEHRQ